MHNILRTGAFQLGIEGTRGTEAAAQVSIMHEGGKFDDDVEYVTHGGSTGTIDASVAQKVDTVMFNGNYQGGMDLESAIYEAVLMMGGAPTFTEIGSTGIYTLEYGSNATSNTHKTGTFRYKDPIDDFLWTSCMLDKYSVSATHGKLVERTVELMGNEANTSAANTSASYIGSDDLIAFAAEDIEVSLADTVALLDNASAVLNAQTIDFDVDKNAGLLMKLGTRSPFDAVNKARKIEGGFSIYYADQTLRDIVFSGVPQAMRIRMRDTSHILGTHNGENIVPLIEYTYPRVFLKDRKPSEENDEVRSHEIDFEASRDNTVGAQIQHKIIAAKSAL